mmetsp:Transcript_48335/g.120989  ORF Transcript_48335/g.120989 Transcript_48335/m.120989 type:complete len:237 (+) Transcript_48335:270-980(+)
MDSTVMVWWCWAVVGGWVDVGLGCGVKGVDLGGLGLVVLSLGVKMPRKMLPGAAGEAREGVLLLDALLGWGVGTASVSEGDDMRREKTSSTSAGVAGLDGSFANDSTQSSWQAPHVGLPPAPHTHSSAPAPRMYFLCSSIMASSMRSSQVSVCTRGMVSTGPPELPAHGLPHREHVCVLDSARRTHTSPPAASHPVANRATTAAKGHSVKALVTYSSARRTIPLLITMVSAVLTDV